MLLGKTQLELGRDGDAVQSLVRAKELTAEDRESIDRHVEVNLLLAEAAGKTGDNKRVSECYDELLSVDPTVQSFYMQKAQAEQYAGEHIAALGTLLTGIAYATDSSSLHLEAKRLIRSLEAEDFEPAEKLFRQLQANKEQLKDETALYEWRRGSYRLDWSDPDSLERAKGRFTEALALDPKDPSILANLYGFLVLVNSYKDNTAAEGYLAKIDSLPTVDLAKEIREWLMRVRASYLLSKGKDFYGDAYSVAKQGRAINDSKQAELLQAQTATLTARNRDTLMEIERTARYEEAHDLVLPLARERYASLADAILSEVNRNLNRNQETQVLFTSLVEKNPKDLPAVQGLMEVCAEYLFDFQCALNAALRYAAAMPAGAKMDVGQQINTAEAGTLTGNLELANQWLASALSDNGLPQDLRAVAFLYRTWVSAVSTTSDDLREPFEQWREATGELRRRGTPLGWSFRGAKHALERGSMNEKHRNLLHQMIATLEDASSPLPEWAP